MLIGCACCGSRDVSEFTYFGDATVVRPALDAAAQAWFATVYQRRNPKGSHTEFWQHSAGCRAFLRVVRNTLTHEISAVELVGPFAKSMDHNR